ncbi:site-2 protease family protein [Thermomonospora catenispora]|uniref:site-2 protease family protein n=1 Tax=Thermomonospora catenispora TaxID=2493090 RepID=UPI001120FFC9|nr:site-2 protease family protein [Thermomonospora catenispora]TNY37011.1 site-2 protease family protein [Thermomonospora catenispora]
MGTVHELTGGRSVVRPSPVFLGIVGLTVLCGVAAWRQEFYFDEKFSQFAVFGLVLAGWILSLCLHEFGHAYLAYRSGDHGAATRGYLTLNPLKYGDVTLSFLLPVLFILMGGIGLPGGAVWIDRGRIPGRLRHSLISAAGPLANLAFAIVLAVAVTNLRSPDHLVFWSALAFLTFLQVTAALLNLLPIPGLDGFGIVEPYLPRRWAAKANEVGGYAFLILLAVLWIPPVNGLFFDVVLHVTDLLGVQTEAISDGLRWFRAAIGM